MLCASFDKWEPQRMARAEEDTGAYEVYRMVPPGPCHYVFLVDSVPITSQGQAVVDVASVPQLPTKFPQQMASWAIASVHHAHTGPALPQPHHAFVFLNFVSFLFFSFLFFCTCCLLFLSF